MQYLCKISQILVGYLYAPRNFVLFLNIKERYKTTYSITWHKGFLLTMKNRGKTLGTYSSTFVCCSLIG